MVKYGQIWTALAWLIQDISGYQRELSPQTCSFEYELGTGDKSDIG
jgi:hypothetical protein